MRAPYKTTTEIQLQQHCEWQETFTLLRRVILRTRSGGSREGAPLLWVKKEEITEGRKAGRASKTKPTPPPPVSWRSGSEKGITLAREGVLSSHAAVPSSVRTYAFFLIMLARGGVHFSHAAVPSSVRTYAFFLIALARGGVHSSHAAVPSSVRTYAFFPDNVGSRRRDCYF